MNEDKSAMLSSHMFSSQPNISTVLEQYLYDNQLSDPPGITEEQIHWHLANLSPYKAPGRDGIPNIMLKSCVETILPYLAHIFRASLHLKVYLDQWRESITCVLHKPEKPRYDIPKAYQPVTLLNTITKLLSSIVMET